MSPPVPFLIPLTTSSQTQIVPKIQNDDQLPFKATLRTLSSFIKDNHRTPTQSTTSIPLQSVSTPIRTTPTSPLSQTQPLTYTQPQPQPQIQPLNLNPTTEMAHTTTTVTTRPSLFARLRGGKTHHRTYENSTHGHTTHATHGARRQRTWGRRTAQPVHHHHRKPSMGDKISGAMMKLRGSLTRRPGLKVSLPD